MLYSDISGFTALTEKLPGREGAEEIADAINRAFRPAIRTIGSLGGSIVSFGGDSLFSIFVGPAAVRWAHSAAMQIDAGFEEGIVTSVGPARLRLKQVIHFGTVKAMHLSAGERYHYLTTGRAATALARRAEGANPGSICLSSRARKREKVESEEPARLLRRPQISGAVYRRYVDPQLLPLIGRSEGEYRQLGVLFVETRGNDTRALQRFFGVLDEALRVHGGVLLKTDLSAHGTAWLAGFGIPRAREDDAAAAAAAALHVVGRIPARLRVRAAVHAGIVANLELGTGSRRSFDVMGRAINTAARALSLADWGEAVVTASTRKSSMQTTVRRRRRVKGLKRSLVVHRLDRVRATARTVLASTPLVGRKREVSRLRRALGRARAGEGRVVVVTGEAGMGKSRLAMEVTRHATELGFAVLEGRSAPFGGTSLGAWVGILRRILGVEGMAPERWSEAFDAAVRRLQVAVPEVERLRPLISPHEEEATARPSSDVREQTIQALMACLGEACRAQPTIVVLDDLQWADALSLEVLGRVARTPGALLVLGLARPEHTPPPAAVRIEMSELPPRQSRELMRRLLGGLPSGLANVFLQGSRGVPLYIEQGIRHLVETGGLVGEPGHFRLARELGRTEIPSGVELLLQARLDRLSRTARHLLQVTSVVGTRFSRTFIEPLVGLGRDLEPALTELHRQGLLEVLGTHSDGYAIRHALIRDTAYSTLLLRRRREIHGRVAQRLQDLGPPGREHLAVLGYHWEMGGERDEARRCYYRAAHVAFGLSDLELSYDLLGRILRLTKEDDELAAHARVRLVEYVLRIWGRHKESRRQLDAAFRAARRLEDKRLQALCLCNLAWLDRIEGHTKRAVRRYQRSLELVQGSDKGKVEIQCFAGLGMIDAAQGNLERAESLMRQGMAHPAFTRRVQGSYINVLGGIVRKRGRVEEAEALHREAVERSRATGNRWILTAALGDLSSAILQQGRAEEALALNREATEINREVGDPRFAAILELNRAMIHEALEDLSEARRWYRKAIRMVRAIGVAETEAEATNYLGWTQIQIGQYARAHDTFERVLRLVGRGAWVAEFVARLGIVETWRARGELERARSILGNLRRQVRRRGDRNREASVHAELANLARLYGRLSRAEQLLAAGRGLVETPLTRARLECEHGHWLLAQGRDASAALALAVEQLSGSPVEPSGLRRSVAALRAAQSGWTRGEPLIRGEAPDVVPRRRLIWLRRHGARPIRWRDRE